MDHSVHQWTYLILLSMLGYLLSCGNKPPPDSTLLLISTPDIGSIAAREQVLRGLMALHNQQFTNADQHFKEAYRFDPHPTIVELRTQIQQATMRSTPEEL